MYSLVDDTAAFFSRHYVAARPVDVPRESPGVGSGPGRPGPDADAGGRGSDETSVRTPSRPRDPEPAEVYRFGPGTLAGPELKPGTE
jgi:hypothetical protein